MIDLECNLSLGYTQTQHDWEQGPIDTWLLNEKRAIQRTVAQRAHVEQPLNNMEIAVHGAVQH